MIVLTKPAAMIFLLVVISMHGFAQNGKTIKVKNPVNQQRNDELVIISRSLVTEKLGVVPASKFIAVTGPRHQKLTVQHDDLDGDGQWDEAVFLYSFAPKEKAKFSISITGNIDLSAATAKAYIRLRKMDSNKQFGPSLAKETMPYHNVPTDFGKQPLPLYLTEGPTWENDKIAFRLYFDTRNGKDVFGKITDKMVMENVGAARNNSYHELSEWGMDILHVGQSLGAGSIALLVPLRDGRDSLMRVGGKGIEKVTYEQVANGPLRVIFRMHYFGWMINGKPVEIIDETSTWGGQYFYESKINVSGAPAGTRLVAGVGNFSKNTIEQRSNKRYAFLTTHGKQSENKDYLGLAIMAGKQFDAFGVTPDAKADILNTNYLVQKFKNGSAVYRFYAGWEKTLPAFSNEKYFASFIEQQAILYTHPVKIK